MSWFTQYRPTTIARLHSQSVQKSFQNLLTGKSFPHALLFAGPKGTGKTSSARIVGALLNDPQNKQAVQQMLAVKNNKTVTLKEVDPDDPLVTRIRQGISYVVTEMDAASHRGIDDIRLLKERLILPPQEGQVAVYILDEVHMLTNEAFNALLKVLEEPPAHVVFILATTELHKVPATVVSRCTMIQFHRATETEIIQSLTEILEQEKITYEAAALELIAQAADGSFRDAVKTLETIAQNQSKITLERVSEILGSGTFEDFSQFIQSILAKDTRSVVAYFEKLRSKKVDQKYFFSSLLRYLHHQLVQAIHGEKEAISSDKVLLFLLDQFQELEPNYVSSFEFLPIELKTLELIFRSQEKKQTTNSGSNSNPSAFVPTRPAPSKQSSSSATFSQTPAASFESFSAEIATEKIPVIIQETHIVADQKSTTDGKILIEKWETFLDQLHLENISLELLLRSAKPVSGQPGKVTVEVYYQFHKEQLEQPKFSQLIQHIIANLVGGPVFLEFIVARKKVPNVQDANIQPVAEDTLLKMAEEVLG